jgi:hypothetical protein
MKSVLVVTFALALMLGCVETTSVEAPDEVEPSTTFQAIVHIAVVDTNALPDSSFTGLLSVLIPDEWFVDSVFVEGYGYSGPMLQGDCGWQLGDTYPPESGYQWVGFHTPQELTGWLGDVGQATVFVSTDENLGTYTTAYLGRILALSPSVGFLYEGDPCSCAVEVTPLHLEQETWGAIKTELGE